MKTGRKRFALWLVSALLTVSLFPAALADEEVLMESSTELTAQVPPPEVSAVLPTVLLEDCKGTLCPVGGTGEYPITVSAGQKTGKAELPLPGEYLLTLPGYVPWQGQVWAGANTVLLVRFGDVNGDGAPVSSTDGALDLQCLFTYLSTSRRTGALSSDPDYFDAAADVNGSGTVDILDYQALYEMVSR